MAEERECWRDTITFQLGLGCLCCMATRQKSWDGRKDLSRAKGVEGQGLMEVHRLGTAVRRSQYPCSDQYCYSSS